MLTLEPEQLGQKPAITNGVLGWQLWRGTSPFCGFSGQRQAYPVTLESETAVYLPLSLVGSFSCSVNL